VVVDGYSYLVDCGYGVARQLARSGLGLLSLRDIFITHLHSDHVADYFTLLLLGWAGLETTPAPLHAYGPGQAGGVAALPGEPAGEAASPVANPANPTPGLSDLTRTQMAAHAYDLNVRMREAGHRELSQLVAVRELPIPSDWGARPPDHVAPAMDPIVVKEDENVTVTAILVNHPPVFPSFAYRFDTSDGAVVISGDTTPSANLITLAHNADVLVHEVVDTAYMKGLSLPPDKQRALRHVVESHTDVNEVGAVAARADVGTLVLSHFIPGNDALSDHDWVKSAEAGFSGRVVAGRDLLELEV
jgi:ribonuclease BN (tRNA processing enzyme)